MEIGTVKGSVWATKKDEGLNGQKLLVIEIMSGHQQKNDILIVAADVIGAGVGDMVLVCRGNSARYAAGDGTAPVDAAVIGIIDSLEVQEFSKNDGGALNGHQ